MTHTITTSTTSGIVNFPSNKKIVGFTYLGEGSLIHFQSLSFACNQDGSSPEDYEDRVEWERGGGLDAGFYPLVIDLDSCGQIPIDPHIYIYLDRGAFTEAEAKVWGDGF